MPTYTTSSRVANYLQRSLTTEESNIVDSVIDSVSASVSAYLNREYKDTGDTDEVADTTRYYDGVPARYLFIDDVSSVSEVVLLDTQGDSFETLESDDYLLHPMNSTPKNSIYLRNRYFPVHPQSVKVTASFTSGDLPIEVDMATATLVGHFFTTSVNKGYKSERIEGYEYVLATDKEMNEKKAELLGRLDHLRKIEF